MWGGPPGRGALWAGSSRTRSSSRPTWTSAAGLESRPANAPSYHTPSSPQNPLRTPQHQRQQKHNRHVPQILGLTRGNTGFRVRNLIRQLAGVRGAVVSPAGLIRQLTDEISY